MRVLVGPVEIAGVAKGLVKGFIENGAEAKLVLSDKHPFSYGGSNDSWFIRVWQAIGGRRGSTPAQYLLRKALYVALHMAWGWLILLWSIFRFDGYVFLFGRTLTDARLELVLLKVLRKKIVFINVGSDFRPPYMDGGVFPWTNPSPNIKKVMRRARRLKNKIVFIEKYADCIVSAPGSAQFHEKPFINWFSMGVPAAFENDAATVPDGMGRVRILHSPSNPTVKGSDRICEVIERLIARGYPIDFFKLQGVSNQEVLNRLAHCDLVVDQLYSDLPLAVLGSEAARFGKPCVVAGYMAEGVSRYIREEDIPPSVYVLPDNLEAAVEELVCNADLREKLGLRAQSFVRQHWSCSAVAKRYLELFEGRVRAEWWFDPARIDYVGGCGMPIDYVRFLVRSLVERFGIQALRVGDKPVLERRLLALISRDGATTDA